MIDIQKPAMRPARPYFSSGPCVKHLGWSPERLPQSALGRSHRSQIGKQRLGEVIDRTRALLNIPEDYLIGIVPASDTGAMEMAMWSLLGVRGVDILAWESFGQGWVQDVVKQLKLDANLHISDYGQIPDFSKIHPDNDLIFTWNGTTSGVRVPDVDFIQDDREGLVICDATSAVFAQKIDWQKLDVITWSWQKILGGEGAHGMLVLSPHSVERLENYTPAWPLPKIFRLTKNGKLNHGIFRGETINTPSMLCVEDVIDALIWAEKIGGISGMQTRSDQHLKVIESWVNQRDWIDFLCANPATRSNSSVCLKITDKTFLTLGEGDQRGFIKKMTGLLEQEKAAFDIAGYRDAPPGLRIWCGATVERDDVVSLLPWLDWAFSVTKQPYS